MLVSPVLVPVWFAGLRAPFKRNALRALRFVSWTYVTLAVIYIVGNVLARELLPDAARHRRAADRGLDESRAEPPRALAVAIAVSGLIPGLLALP